MMERKLKDVKEDEKLFLEIVDIQTGKVVYREEIRLAKRKIGSFYDWILTRVNLNDNFVRIVDEKGNLITDLGGKYG